MSEIKEVSFYENSEHGFPWSVEMVFDDGSGWKSVIVSHEHFSSMFLGFGISPEGFYSLIKQGRGL